MSDPNRWEPLHRLSTAYALAAAVFGGAAVSAFVKGIAHFFASPDLPWWGDFLVAGMLAAIIFWLLRSPNRHLNEAQAFSGTGATRAPTGEPAMIPAPRT